MIDRFTLHRIIAVGVESITYRATETSTGRPFALREFVPGAATGRLADGRFTTGDEQAVIDVSAGVAQFLADGAGAAILNHAGIARVSRWFKANGTAYMVLSLLPGQSLVEALQARGKLTARETVAIVTPLIEALEYLHGLEVVHLELAPAGIQVLESGGAALLGSGVAAARRGAAGLAGQPGPDLSAYAAIEQFRPDGSIGPWTDIYQLAATLHHCATGMAPPTAPQRLAAVQRGDSDPLPAVKLAAGANMAEREIATLIERGLALEPSARPQSVREWRARIARTSTRVEGETGALIEPHDIQTRQRLPAILLAVFLLGIAGIGYYLWSTQTDDARSASVTVHSSDWISPEEVERWRQALEANAVIGYRAFMEDFPQSVHIQQAQEQIGVLEDKAWELIVAEGTRAAYEAHLEMFPEGRHVTEALARIEEFRQQEARLAREQEERLRLDDEAWNSARSAGTVAALDTYISTWPGGTHVSEAHDLRQKMQGGINDTENFNIARGQNTIEAYRSYIQNFPAGTHVSAAQQAIEDLTLRRGKTFRDCADCPAMVVVPSGAFWQGSAEASPLALSIEKPRRRVVIAESFAIGVHEITMAQWDACVADQGCDTQPADNGWGRGNRPVIMVSWGDAQQYAEWLSQATGQAYVLPTESQWEYAARGGEESDWLGGDPAGICAFGNIAGNETRFDWRHTACADNSELGTMPGGSYQPNAFGLYDVIGNVAEWTLDCMNLSYLEAPTDGSAWSRGMCSSRLTRGGSWFTGAKESRLAARFNLKNGDRNDFTGFRLVRRVEKQ